MTTWTGSNAFCAIAFCPHIKKHGYSSHRRHGMIVAFVHAGHTILGHATALVVTGGPDLSLKPQCAPRHKRPLSQDTTVVQKVPCCNIVRTIQDDVIPEGGANSTTTNHRTRSGQRQDYSFIKGSALRLLIRGVTSYMAIQLMGYSMQFNYEACK